MQAALTLGLYWLGWLPGVIANFMFLAEADRIREKTGTPPSGRTALGIMLNLFFWLPVFAFLGITLTLLVLIRLDRMA